MQSVHTAILFAAGRGLRLRPLTDSIPKPLCTIHDTPLLDYHFEALKKSGITRILLNHAYLGDQIRRHIYQKQYHTQFEIIFLPEPPGGFLTGGTLIHALPYLGNTPFLALNADVFTHYDFSKLGYPKNNLAHLVLIPNAHDYPKKAFNLTAEKKLSYATPDCIFSGIAIYHPNLFNTQPKGRHSVIPWIKAAADQGLASGEHYEGFWCDTGTPERLAKAHQGSGNVLLTSSLRTRA